MKINDDTGWIPALIALLIIGAFSFFLYKAAVDCEGSLVRGVIWFKCIGEE